VAVDLRCDFLRLAAPQPHRVRARCLRSGRTLAVADVEITPWDEPERLVAVGRAQFARVSARE
jgi:acyl-coenzyme A thioesterase PaaI-like protein